MARLVTSGGEIRDHPTTNAGSPDGYSGGAAATTTETSVVRSGSASFKCAGTAANTSFRIFPVTFASAANRWARVWVRFSALPNATKKIIAVTGGATLHCSVRLTSAGKLQLWNDRSGAVLQIGSDSAATLAVDTWYRLELQVNVSTASSAATANDTVELRVGVPEDDPTLGGTSVASGTVALGNTLPTEVRSGWVDAPGVTSDMFVDDVAVNDSAGTAENSWPTPDGGIVVVTVAAGQGVQEWTTCGATTGTDDMCESLDAPPVGHADTTTDTTPFHQVRNASATSPRTYTARTISYGHAGVRGASRVDTSLASDANSYPVGNGGQRAGFDAAGVTSEKRGAQFYLAGTLDYVEVWLKAIGAPTDDLVVEIVEGVPVGKGYYTTPQGGTTLLTQTVPMTSLSMSGSWVRVQFDNTPLTQGQGYWVVLSRSGANDASNYLLWPGAGTGADISDHARTAWQAGTANWAAVTPGSPLALRVFPTQGLGEVRLVTTVACVGQAGSATAQNGGLATLSIPPVTEMTFTWSAGAIAGTYPTGWKWVSLATQYKPVLKSVDRDPRPQLKRVTTVTTDISLCCFLGAIAEFANPLNPG